MNLGLYCVKYAQSSLPESMVFAGGSREKRIPIAFVIYCICTGDRKILVDAGCDTMPGFEMIDHRSPAVALKDIGIAPEQITDVILTHAHHDHAESLRHFPNALIHVTDGALPSAQRYIPENAKVKTWSGSCQIADGITALEIGGHAKGSAIVAVETQTLTHILAGDECYTDENIAQKRCTGSFASRENAENFIQTYSSCQYCVHTCHDSALKTERIL